MTLQLLLASAAVKLLPMTEPVAASDAAELARVEFDMAPSMVEHFVPAQYPPGKGQPGYGWPSRIEDYTVDDALAERLAAYQTDEYYLQMMIAWYFATALAKRYDDILPYFRTGVLAPAVRKMAVRKAKDSFRITKEQKELLGQI